MKIILTLFALLSSVLLISQDAKLPIIDMHMHSYPVDYMGESNIPNPATGRPSGAARDEELMQATLFEMHRFAIVKAVTSGPIDVVYRWSSEEPKRLIGGVYFDEATSLPDVEQLRQQFMSGRLGVLGELVAQHAGLSLNDSLFDPYLTLAEELDIPVGVHTGLGHEGLTYTCCPKFRVS